MYGWFTYVLLGLSLSAPIGPINAAQLDKGARYGFVHAWLIGIGAMCADAFYMALVYFGVAHFVNTPFMKTILYVFGCFVLVYLGIDSLKSGDTSLRSGEGEERSRMRSFRDGFLMAMTNPLNMLFWLGIYGSILAENTSGQLVTLVWNSSGIFAGILLWDLIMAMLASAFHRIGRPWLLGVISRVAGLSLIAFGLYFGYQALLLLKG